MTSPSIETRDLTIRFGGHTAVNAVSCAFHPGELTVIVGPNGAGKTTYFSLISGQLPPSTGTVLKNGADITRLSPSARAKAGIGRAFQLTNLFPKLSVLENVRLAVQARRGIGPRLFRPASAFTDIADRAHDHLKATRLDSVANLPAAALPHGDQRKLEVALLLAMEPDVFMFDEPTAGMSVDEAPVILELIDAIRKDTTKTVLLVEHKMDVVRALADRIIVLHNGELVADGPPDEVIALPVVREIYLGIPADEEAAA
ncbi:ABC transporter ATP-binding protein [Oricola sp.]|uniref:ABC transporter ATP-binding protein n=1 Tax=Oricola sp. TaxID=1979950 RepID=UPI003BAA0916